MIFLLRNGVVWGFFDGVVVGKEGLLWVGNENSLHGKALMVRD